MDRRCFTCLHVNLPTDQEPCRPCYDSNWDDVDRPGWTPQEPTVPSQATPVPPGPVSAPSEAPAAPEGVECLDCTREEWCGPCFAARDWSRGPTPVEVAAAARDVVINPKEIAGSKKPAVWNVVPRWVVALVGRVMSVGAAKYGRFNYRDSTVSAMTYVDAIERHMQLWQDGEEKDPETGVSHLASVMAGCAILLDAQANGRMGDDRPKTGLARKTLDELQELLTSLPLPAPQY